MQSHSWCLSAMPRLSEQVLRPHKMFLYRLEKVKDINTCCALVCSENAFVPKWVASYDNLRSAIKMQLIYSVPKWSQYQSLLYISCNLDRQFHNTLLSCCSSRPCQEAETKQRHLKENTGFDTHIRGSGLSVLCLPWAPSCHFTRKANNYIAGE